MQDRTINNALLALAKQGGAQGRIADGLLVMRGVKWSGVYHQDPLVRGKTRALIARELECAPKSSGQLTDALQAQAPGIGRRSAYNRVYQALLRLEQAGKVCRDGPDGDWHLSEFR